MTDIQQPATSPRVSGQGPGVREEQPPSSASLLSMACKVVSGQGLGVSRVASCQLLVAGDEPRSNGVVRSWFFVLRHEQRTTNNEQRPSCYQPLATGNQQLRSRRDRAAFTLTEVLVVITILAILAALSTVGIMRALDTAKQSAIKIELDNIAAALQTYKDTYGSFPPSDLRDPATNVALRSHVARAFPRYNIGNLEFDLAATGVDTTNFRPDQALVFWLQGFSPDVTNPFIDYLGQQLVNGIAGSVVNVTPLFDFDQTRLIARVVDTAASYFPAGAKVNTTPGSPYPLWSSGSGPYLYWDAGNYGIAAVPDSAPSSGDGATAIPTFFNSSPLLFADAGVSVPYWHDTNGNRTSDDSTDTNDTWVSPDSFQLIAAGLDGKYGNVGTSERLYPTGFGYDAEGTDDDNITNFSEKARLGDAKP